MKKRSAFIIFTLALSLMIGGITLLFNKPDSSTQPIAVKGVMDLRGYPLHHADPIRLDGEWEFVSGKLMSAQEFEKQERHFVQVPSLWKNYKLNGEDVPKYTSGTYRLRILVDSPDEIYGLKTSNIRMSNAIYMNGRKIGSSGSPKEDLTYTSHNNPYAAYFSPGQEEVEILVHVANFDYASGGGIVGSIMLGNQESIGKLRETSLIYDWVTITAFLTMSLYFIGSFLHLRMNLEQFYFSVFCFANVLYTSSHGEKILCLLFPSMPYGVFERIQFLSTLLIGLCGLLYFCYSLKEYAHQIIFKVLFIIGILLNMAMFLPIKIHSNLQIVLTIYIFIIILYIIYIQISAIRKRSSGALYLIISSLTMFIYFIIATLNVMTNVEINYLPPLFPFICLTMLSLFISHRFSTSYLKKDELSKALMRVDKMKDEFFAKTSHEFRTPLHGIIAITQSMVDDSESTLSPAEKEKITLISSTAKRLAHLVHDILDFSKLKEGELKLSLTSVDLFASASVITELFTYLTKKDIKLVNNVPRGQFVMADEERLRQILYNVIDNAIKYTEHGVVEIVSFEQDNKVVIEIIDTGIELTSEKIKTLFLPFQQSNQSSDGVGLGLSITKELVTAQGGEVRIDSTPGKGTTFSIILPKAVKQLNEKQDKNLSIYENQQHVHLSIPYVLNKKGNYKILIADDDHINLKVLINILSIEEYDIIAVDSGNQVLQQMEKHPDIDLVILDIMMPELTGYEVCQQLRKTYLPSELPILMLTAAIHPQDMIIAFESGANDFLHKPIESAELKTRIRNLLLMKESAQQAISHEVAFLQAQIKPHFIYNVLNSILSLSYLDLDKARKMITDFATFLRGNFSFENTSQLVPLHKELSLVQSYVNIHSVRFPDQLEWELQMKDAFHCFIPPLLLQPLVENAILHGLKAKSDGGKIKLIIHEEHGIVTFQIIDNGGGISEEKLHQIWNHTHPVQNGIGLHNIAKRIKYYENASISIQSKENQGTTVVITFPLIHNEKGVKSLVESHTR